ncbi:hypothetical protein JN09_001164 [Acholeplasma morum]|uniref:LlaJI family restriction endonuclease n=1 Tax=Paracholeplasma morum TaxID=264637 RepID=UPI00195B72C5|nr:LlaJI family restriction endonuclease [Paracholeplasma morum]MBM7453831.1 hypothetical protein [Paracholeplasma morum]
MPIDRDHFNLREHCHVNSNEDGDRFVGVKADSDNVVIYFPMGYELPTSEDELKRDIKNLFNVLATFTDKTDRILHMDRFTAPHSVEFPIQAYLNVINYYLDHNGNYYTETESTYKVDKRGKTDWSRTIKTQTPMIQGKSLLYFNQVVRVSSQNSNRLITRIHKYCVYESFEKIGWLYTTNKPEQPDIVFDKTKFIATLNDKLSNTNNDNDKKLFRSMIAMIEFMDDKTIDKQFYFGTDRFETVWEKLIDKYFGEPNKHDYFPHAKWTEKYGPAKGRPTSALEPDTIMIYRDKYYVLDAKYYRYGILPRLGINALPQSSDINKQITYGQYVKNNKAPVGLEVFNAFIMPFNKSNNDFKITGWYGNVAEAIGDWISTHQVYERIQGIVVDTRYLLKNYDGNHDYDKELLSIEIEKVLTD